MSEKDTTTYNFNYVSPSNEGRHIVLMRPVNQIIEFKQIVGRGTRLFDGKEFFTIYD
jgi:type I restriction enzyme R subunit